MFTHEELTTLLWLVRSHKYKLESDKVEMLEIKIKKMIEADGVKVEMTRCSPEWLNQALNEGKGVYEP